MRSELCNKHLFSFCWPSCAIILSERLYSKPNDMLRTVHAVNLAGRNIWNFDCAVQFQERMDNIRFRESLPSCLINKSQERRFHNLPVNIRMLCVEHPHAPLLTAWCNALQFPPRLLENHIPRLHCSVPCISGAAHLGIMVFTVWRSRSSIIYNLSTATSAYHQHVLDNTWQRSVNEGLEQNS